MKNEFITYEQALALKELGFDEPCFGYYIETGKWIPASYSKEGMVYPSNSDLFPEWVASPTYQQAFRWFREKHNLHSHISLGISDEQDRSEFEYDEYTFVIEGVKELDFNNYGEESFYKTPEEAELACLKKLIEIIKQK